MKYKCIREMTLEKYDEDIGHTGVFSIVPVNSTWIESKNNYIDGEIHLDAISGLDELDDFSWIEISKESLKANFKEVSDETY